MDLFDWAAGQGPPPRPRTIQEQFEAFHRAHPDVYELFKRFAQELRAAGRPHYGAKAILERVRWHYATSSASAEEFKINNNYTSRYARLLIAECPEFADFFETRRLTSA